jgi:hypothetical protein
VQDLSGVSDAFAPGGIVALAGDRLTSGSFWDAVAAPLPLRLAGTHVEVNGVPASLFSAKPDRLLVELPTGLVPGQPASLTVSSVNRTSVPVALSIVPAAPAILAAVRSSGALVVYMTGLGATLPAVAQGAVASTSPLSRTTSQPTVLVNGQAIPVLFSGMAAGLVGVYRRPGPVEESDVVFSYVRRKAKCLHQVLAPAVPVEIPCVPNLFEAVEATGQNR